MTVSIDAVVAGVKSVKASREKDPKTDKWVKVKSEPKNKLTFIDIKKVSPTAVNKIKLEQDAAAPTKPGKDKIK